MPYCSTSLRNGFGTVPFIGSFANDKIHNGAGNPGDDRGGNAKGLIQDEDSDNYMEASSGSDNQILGYANCVQGTMELECQLVTNGLYCGDSTGYEDPRRKELEAGKNDWVLLLQIDSEEDKTGMMWGDSGRIYFWIKKQDLLNKNFNNTWCILQCY